MTAADVMNEPPIRVNFHPESPIPPFLPPLLRFFIAALWAVGVFWGSGFIYALFPDATLLPDLLFRLVACVLTAAGFAFFLRVLDYNPILCR